MAKTIDYKQSGVDVGEGYKAVGEYKKSAAKTAIPGVLTGIGSFNGMFAVPKHIKEPVMVSGTDGVGTKLDVAFKMKKYDTVGIDCVAMSVNDILCSGVRTLFFLDYIACSSLDAKIAGKIVEGIAEGCKDAGCALLGGETAEMPGFYDTGKYDVAGFGVGIAEKKEQDKSRRRARRAFVDRRPFERLLARAKTCQRFRRPLRHRRKARRKSFRQNDRRRAFNSDAHLRAARYRRAQNIPRFGARHGTHYGRRLLRKSSAYVSESKRTSKTAHIDY